MTGHGAPAAERIVETTVGPVAVAEAGVGPPVLFVHGSPGGSDQGLLMSRFLVAAGFRVIAPSRPGYLGTTLTDANGTADGTAELLNHALDALEVPVCALACWSGGGPSSYELAARHPDRVRTLVACAAVSGDYRFAGGVAGLESSLMGSGLGGFLLRAMADHLPKELIASTVKEEGDLSRREAKELAAHIWSDETKRDFVLELSATLSGRKAGLQNDQQRFPALTLPLPVVSAPTLLVHGTADADVGPEQSERALAALGNAEILRVEKGTHICVWTDPAADEVQRRIVEHLRA